MKLTPLFFGDNPPVSKKASNQHFFASLLKKKLHSFPRFCGFAHASLSAYSRAPCVAPATEVFVDPEKKDNSRFSMHNMVDKHAEPAEAGSFCLPHSFLLFVYPFPPQKENDIRPGHGRKKTKDWANRSFLGWVEWGGGVWGGGGVEEVCFPVRLR